MNALAYAEFKLGKHAVKESLVYVAVGNTVEVGIIAQGKPVHGLLHPDGGHIMYEILNLGWKDLLISTKTSKEHVHITRTEPVSQA